MLVDDPVKRVDNMMMAHALEARVPFLDHEFVELAAACPPELKLADGGKGVLKRAARGVVPDAVIDREKGYFPVPALTDLEEPVLGMVREALLAPEARERGLFRPDVVEAMLADPNATAPTSTARRCGSSGCWSCGCRSSGRSRAGRPAGTGPGRCSPGRRAPEPSARKPASTASAYWRLMRAVPAARPSRQPGAALGGADVGVHAPVEVELAGDLDPLVVALAGVERRPGRRPRRRRRRR